MKKLTLLVIVSLIHDPVFSGGTVDSLVEKGNKIYLDMATGLMWKESDGITRNWLAASFHCTTANIANKTDWYLPSVKELSSLVRHNKYPAMDFRLTVPATSAYWTRTTVVSDTTKAWYLSANSGATLQEDKSSSGVLSAICVRKEFE